MKLKKTSLGLQGTFDGCSLPEGLHLLRYSLEEPIINCCDVIRVQFDQINGM